MRSLACALLIALAGCEVPQAPEVTYGQSLVVAAAAYRAEYDRYPSTRQETTNAFGHPPPRSVKGVEVRNDGLITLTTDRGRLYFVPGRGCVSPEPVFHGCTFEKDFEEPQPEQVVESPLVEPPKMIAVTRRDGTTWSAYPHQILEPASFATLSPESQRQMMRRVLDENAGRPIGQVAQWLRASGADAIAALRSVLHDGLASRQAAMAIVAVCTDHENDCYARFAATHNEAVALIVGEQLALLRGAPADGVPHGYLDDPVTFLGKIGPPARAALPELLRLLRADRTNNPPLPIPSLIGRTILQIAAEGEEAEAAAAGIAASALHGPWFLVPGVEPLLERVVWTPSLQRKIDDVADAIVRRCAPPANDVPLRSLGRFGIRFVARLLDRPGAECIANATFTSALTEGWRRFPSESAAALQAAKSPLTRDHFLTAAGRSSALLAEVHTTARRWTKHEYTAPKSGCPFVLWTRSGDARQVRVSFCADASAASVVLEKGGVTTTMKFPDRTRGMYETAAETIQSVTDIDGDGNLEVVTRRTIYECGPDEECTEEDTYAEDFSEADGEWFTYYRSRARM